MTIASLRLRNYILIEELGALDLYLTDLRRFYDARLEDTKLGEYSIYDEFYLLSIASHCNIPVKEEDMANFIQNFSNYIKESKTIDYQLAISVMEDLEMWDVTCSDEFKEKFLTSANGEGSIKNRLTEFMALYYRYAVLKTLNQEYVSAYSEVIDYS